MTVLDGEADTSAEASAEAAQMGERVEDLSARRPDRRVFANPDGTWTAEYTTGPERAKDAAGEWRPLDLTLTKRAGRVAPKVSAERISFSAGGDRELVSWRVKGNTVSWRWPEQLPEPTLEGPRATYADVLPGGDLVVEATPGGFEYSVTLHEPPGSSTAGEDPSTEPSGESSESPSDEPSASASDEPSPSEPTDEASPTSAEPVEISTEVSAPGLTVAESATGGVEVTDADGRMVAAAPQPLMWDSAASVGTDASTPEESEPVEVSVEPTGEGARTVLTPDQSWLADPERVYPVTVDPWFTARPSVDTWLSKAEPNNSRVGSARLQVGTTNGGPDRSRSWLRFGIADIRGKQILRATLKLRNYRSPDECPSSKTIVQSIRESWGAHKLTWNNQPRVRPTPAPGYWKPHGGGSGCSSTADATWDVKSIVENWASGTWANQGLRVRADDETFNGSWRRYRSEDFTKSGAHPRLVVRYNTQPNTPTQLQFEPCAEPDCSTQTTYLQTPTLSAELSDPDGNSLTGEFEVAEAGSTTTVASGTDSGVASGTRASWTVPSGALEDNTDYRFRVRADDGNKESSWSSWIDFTVRTDRPSSAPTAVGIDPCTDCTGEGTAADPWVTPSANPELTASATDPDSAVDMRFEVRDPSLPEGEQELASGSDVVESEGTARYAIDPGVLEDGGTYEFRAGTWIEDGTIKWLKGADGNDRWVTFTVDVDPGFEPHRLFEPLVIFDTGPELSWSGYRDPSPDPGDDLVEFQILRGCVYLPVGSTDGLVGCGTPVATDSETGECTDTPDPDALTDVGPVDPDLRAWTDG